jgi:hypothetical protein
LPRADADHGDLADLETPRRRQRSTRYVSASGPG